MTNTDLQTLEPGSVDRPRLLTAAVTGLSDNSCRAYTRNLNEFFDWLTETRSTLNRESVVCYLAAKHKADAATTYNQALSAIKRLANQSAENNWLTWHSARAIESIPAKKIRGSHTGNWLTLEQAKALLALPDTSMSGLRDRAVLALLVGCGLRRDELSRLEYDQVQQRDGRTYLIDILGKGNRTRTIGVPEWVEGAIWQWLNVSHIQDGALVRSFKSDGRLNGSLSVSAIWDIAQQYAERLGVNFTPHDLRRTFAQLSRKGGAPIEVIQHSLGHSSVATTERYMRTGEDANAGDWIDL